MKIAPKEIPANQKWLLGGFYFEIKAIADVRLNVKS